MPRERFFNLPPETRTRLLEIALAEFAARGFEDASLNGILAAAGLSKGVYYYYFEDKEDLFVTALETALGELLPRLPLPAFERLTPAEFWPEVERVFVGWTALFDSSRDLLRAALGLSEERRRSPRFAAVLEKGRAFWRVIIEAGQRLGCVRTDVPIDVLVRLIEVNDHALDVGFRAANPAFTQRAFEEHVRLVFDTFKRLLAARVSGQI
jgi:AcrR family transcriptional regulator